MAKVLVLYYSATHIEARECLAEARAGWATVDVPKKSRAGLVPESLSKASLSNSSGRADRNRDLANTTRSSLARGPAFGRMARRWRTSWTGRRPLGQGRMLRQGRGAFYRSATSTLAGTTLFSIITNLLHFRHDIVV